MSSLFPCYKISLSILWSWCSCKRQNEGFQGYQYWHSFCYAYVFTHIIALSCAFFHGCTSVPSQHYCIFPHLKNIFVRWCIDWAVIIPFEERSCNMWFWLHARYLVHDFSSVVAVAIAYVELRSSFVPIETPNFCCVYGAPAAIRYILLRSYFLFLVMHITRILSTLLVYYLTILR